jgi:hypothetical protein
MMLLVVWVQSSRRSRTMAPEEVDAARLRRSASTSTGVEVVRRSSRPHLARREDSYEV